MLTANGDPQLINSITELKWDQLKSQMPNLIHDMDPETAHLIEEEIYNDLIQRLSKLEISLQESDWCSSIN